MWAAPKTNRCGPQQESIDRFISSSPVFLSLGEAVWHGDDALLSGRVVAAGVGCLRDDKSPSGPAPYYCRPLTVGLGAGLYSGRLVHYRPS